MSPVPRVPSPVSPSPMSSDPASPATAVLEVEDLVVEMRLRSGVGRPVNGVSLSVRQGETVAVLGESGSGKTVTAMSIMGLLTPPTFSVLSGSIRVLGEEVVGRPAREIRRLRSRAMGLVFQDALSALNPVMKVGAQISEVLTTRGGMKRKQARERATELLDHVGVPKANVRYDDYPHQFSGGMRQRVMIAMALALSPSLLIADEPTTALDVTVQAQIMELLQRLQAESGMSLLLITHDLGVAAQAADRIAVMYGGRVVESGPAADIFRSPRHPYTQGLLRSIPSATADRGGLTPIPGSPPSLTLLPSGCSFRTRCEFATNECSQSTPPLVNTGKDTAVACIRWQDLGRER